MPHYENLKEDELLHLALERDQLTDEARLDLEAELSRRRISAKDLSSYRAECVIAERENKIQTANRLVGFKAPARRGVGFKFLGKSNCRRDVSGRFEEYDSTQWFVVFWFPLFPVATFKVRRNFEPWLGMNWKSDPQAVERYPRNWNQILLTWVKATGFVLILRLTFLWFVRVHR